MSGCASGAARARRFDPVGQTLVILVLGSVVYAIIESKWLGWTSPVIFGLLAVAVLGALASWATNRAAPTRCWSFACSAACRSAE